jgi:hypothetical protein
MQPGYHCRASERRVGMPRRHQDMRTAASCAAQSGRLTNCRSNDIMALLRLPDAMRVTNAPDRRLVNPGGVDLRRSAQGLNASVTDEQSPAGPRGAAERRTVSAEFAMREEEHRDGRQNQDRWLHAGPTAATCTLSVESAGKGHTGVLDEGRARYAPGATNCFSVDCTRITAGSATPPGPTRVRVPKDPLQAAVVRACSRSRWRHDEPVVQRSAFFRTQRPPRDRSPSLDTWAFSSLLGERV